MQITAKAPQCEVLQNPLPRGEIAPRALRRRRPCSRPDAESPYTATGRPRAAAPAAPPARRAAAGPAPPTPPTTSPTSGRQTSIFCRARLVPALAGAGDGEEHAPRHEKRRDPLTHRAAPLPYMRHPCHRITLPHMRHARRHFADDVELRRESAADLRQPRAVQLRPLVEASAAAPEIVAGANKVLGYRLTVSSSSPARAGRFCQSSRRTSRRRAAP